MAWTTQRAVAYCEERGWYHENVESWSGRMRRDLFGIGDLLVFPPTYAWVKLVQVTSWGHHSERVRKILSIERRTGLAHALGLGWYVEVWSFKPDGSQKIDIISGVPPWAEDMS